MSKYKLGFSIGDSYCGENAEVDLIDDYGYTEEEAKEIINDEEKLKEEHEAWLWETIETGFRVLETEDEVED